MELDRRYNAAAPNWRRMLEDHGFPAAYRKLATEAPHSRAQRLIDVGSGSGDLSKAYCQVRQRPIEHVLLDRARSMLDQAQQTFPSAAAIQQDLFEYMHIQPFDVTLCAHVIEHCPNPQAAFHHLARITAPGGSLLLAISRPHFCQVFIWLRWRHRWFSADAVKAMGEAAGLELRRTIPFEKGVPARVSQGYHFVKPQI